MLLGFIVRLIFFDAPAIDCILYKPGSEEGDVLGQGEAQSSKC
jgi:hypothetical protein